MSAQAPEYPPVDSGSQGSFWFHTAFAWKGFKQLAILLRELLVKPNCAVATQASPKTVCMRACMCAQL